MTDESRDRETAGGSPSTEEPDRPGTGPAGHTGAAGEAGAADSAEPVELDERTRGLADEMEREGWTGSPLVVHGDQVLGGLDRYEAARFLGIEDEVPRVGLEDIFAEAGMDMPQIASEEGGTDPEGEFFEDYLRDLPRHVRDKYEI